MFRRVAAAALVVLVNCGAITAPLTHVHLDAVETGHHHGQALHAHLDGHTSPVPSDQGAGIDHEEDAGRTVAAQIYVSGAASPFSLPALVSLPFALIVPPTQVGGLTPLVAHAHDPPSVTVRSPRAPPALLS